MQTCLCYKMSLKKVKIKKPFSTFSKFQFLFFFVTFWGGILSPS